MDSFAVLSQATLWDNALSYPNLVGVAIKYLGTPPSSVYSERLI